MFKLNHDEQSVIFKTSKGEFVLTNISDSFEEGFFIDYFEPGKPVCCLAEIVLDTEEDKLQTHVWPKCVAKSFSDAYTFIHERPYSEQLNELVEAVKHFNKTHEGIDLEIQRCEGHSPYIYELGYKNPKTGDFVTLKRFETFEITPLEAAECAQYYNWRYTEL